MSTEKVIKKSPINELDFGSDSEDSDDDIVPRRIISKNKLDDTTKSIDNKPKKRFLDEDEESDDDDDNNVVIKPKNNHPIKPTTSIINKEPVPVVFAKRPRTDYIFADTATYSFKTWHQCFPDNKVTLRSLIFNPAWNEFFDMVEKKPYYSGMERILSDYLERNKETIVPHAELVFNSFNVISPDKIQVVIAGQDPYPGVNKIGDKMIPQAMGFSFSVPKNYPRPPSLQNINQNLLDYKHIRKIPDSGCLSYWVLQGCFLINAAFTTFFGKKNAHANVWKNFTDDLLAYINTKCENIVFLVWGGFAHKLCLNIDPYRHHIITSSHPSPLGFNKTFSGQTYGKVKNERDRKVVSYPSFQATNHFGRANDYLKSVKKREILWDLF